jgi:Rps23 Pro-64 3,4-dihydroxylase Tpa1-like proline 4-hydroxylase
MTTEQLSGKIAEQLRKHKAELHKYWLSSGPVRHFYLDDVLPTDWALACFNALPPAEQLMERKSVKEHKHVGVEIDKYNKLTGEIIFAFQSPEVLAVVTEITGVTGLYADESLYGSGISMMLEGDFLLPHLDNSHDGDGEKYRVLNALFYITPDWPADKGGNLELWDKDMKQRVEVHSRFNRLVMMETNTTSIHSVNKVQHNGARCCISNYYFSESPVTAHDYVHKTTFYARPEDDMIKKIRLNMEGKAKNFLSRFLDNKTRQTKHRRG